MILKVENLNKSFGGILASRNLDLQVEEHEVHAIVGPNGGGKTTLMAQLSGLSKPDSGKILFKGRNITPLSTHKRVHIGLASSFQITSIIQSMTMLDNILLAVQSLQGHSYKFWAPVSGDAGMRETALNVLENVGLGRQADTIAGKSSHGEQRQLEIAMALALEPDLLLLDEPTSGMSKEESGEMVRLLKKTKGEKTILLIEHDLDAVFALADTTSVLVDGRILATGTAEQIRSNPKVQQAYLGEETA
ncbi:MAG: ATP-binding cassette domain-containing protein [Gammaproteobacteria bacterium]|nr:ATP-binding cassette domain-containing protein [Gammaproteobacteria bacterium]